jgi:flagellar biogenesis protein FliO
MKKWYVIIFLVLITQLFHAEAKVNITDVHWSNLNGKAKLEMTYDGQMLAAPDWMVKDQSFRLELPQTTTKKLFDKLVHGDVKLKVYNQNHLTIVEALFPVGNKLNLDNTVLNIKDKKIEITSPLITTLTPTLKKEVIIKEVERLTTLTTDPKVETKLDESYLAKLETEIIEKPAVVIKDDFKTEKDTRKDSVSFKQSSKKAQPSQFTMVGYAGKFITFLGIVLLLFYGVVQLMKKGFLGKGKLSFINGQQLVSVLSTTYISPKKSLLLIKAHNQIFLVAQTDAGMQLISEIHDFPGMMKSTEKAITGDNFDTNLISSNEQNKEMKIKENIYDSVADEQKAVAKEIVKFSDQIKKKMKTLKSLQ